MIEMTVCCDDCGMLGAAASTAQKARRELKTWDDPWVCRYRDAKRVDLCGPCARQDRLRAERAGSLVTAGPVVE